MNNFLKDVDVFYINLNKDVERNNYTINHFLENGIYNAKRIEAVYGQSENIFIEGLSVEEAGCVLSHIKAIKHFYYNSDKEYALICEDDLNIENIKKINFNFYDTLKLHKPKHYCLQLTFLTREEMFIEFKLRPRTFWDFSTAAYIINKEYAEVLIKYYDTKNSISKNFISMPIYDPRGGTVYTRPVADELIYSLCQTYILPLFTIRHTYSSIYNDNERDRQVIHSIMLFNNEWSSYTTINIERFAQ